MLTIACVLRSGGIYTPEWVERLARQCARHAPKARFVCLSDVPVPCDRFKLSTGWPGWWAKIELFRRGRFTGPVLYLDLDSLVIGPLPDPANNWPSFAALRDFYRPSGLGSGVMAWTPSAETARIYTKFEQVAEKWFEERAGDQAFLEAVMPDAGRIQYRWPELVVSYKAHGLLAGPPPKASIIAFHGKPKFPDLPPDNWAVRAWMGEDAMAAA